MVQRLTAFAALPQGLRPLPVFAGTCTHLVSIHTQIQTHTNLTFKNKLEEKPASQSLPTIRGIGLDRRLNLQATTVPHL